MDEETRSRLAELQATIKLETGRNVTQQDVLARLVDDADGSKSAFVDSFGDDGHGLSFTDATTVALVDEHDIDAVPSFDDDFDGVVERIDPADRAD